MILQITPDSLKVIEANQSYFDTNLIWFCTSILEFGLIIFLLFKIRRISRSNELSEISVEKIKEARMQKIDMDNLIYSIAGSKELYKELSKKCHPDKFFNLPNHKLAEEIFQEISKNRRNYDALLHLKKRAETELNVNFK